VEVGGTVYIRTIIQPTYAMGSAKVRLSVYYSENTDVSSLTPLIDMPSLEFCNLSTSISCPLQAGTHILSWEYRVPDILPGTYQIIYVIMEDTPDPNGNAYSCIQFAITVDGAKSNSYTSWYQATLVGTALFSNQLDYTQRKLGEFLQVGPAGPLNGSISPVPYYGNIKNLAGSGELVPNAFYDTANFVWGLSGQMEYQSTGSNGNVLHMYKGDCYLGYINPNSAAVGNYYDYMTPLISGTFVLNWSYTGSSTAEISGTAIFGPPSTIPYGWGFPLVFGRLGTHEVVTSNVGFLMIEGSLPYCDGLICQTPPAPGKSKGLASDKLGLAIGLPIGIVFLVILAAAAFLYYRKRKETEQEDGIFAVSRKPEYGSALVVDGIIEETMGSKTMQAMLDMREDDGSDESDPESEAEGGSERGERSRSRSKNNRSRSPSRSGESDPGESADSE